MVIHALGELLRGGRTVALLVRGVLLGRSGLDLLGLLGGGGGRRAAAEEAADGVADGRADSDTTGERNMY